MLNVNGIVIYPFIFLAPKDPDPILINHEMIHWHQIQHVGVIAFYIRYLKEYYCHRKQGHSHHQAYMNISFERETYENAGNLAYLKNENKTKV